MHTLAPMANAPETLPAPFGLASRRSPVARLTGGGTNGNERLTSAAGLLLVILLAALGVTIVQLGPLLWVHLFLGMLLIAPVTLKLASTGYRFVRYYTGNPRYRHKGPPQLALRMLAPLVVLSTLVVFASGVALLFAGPSSRSALLPLHKVSFIVWLAVTAPHVLAHLPAMSAGLRADYGRHTQLGQDLPGRSGRALALAGAIVAGLVLALITIPEFAPWMHAHLGHHR